MTRIVVTIDMELLSDVIFSSGNSIPGGTDITLRTDSLGRPYVPGSTIKGLLREALGNYLCWTNTDPNADLQGELNALMGERGVRPIESERRLVCGDLRLAQRDLLEEDCSYLRTFTRLENGAAAHGSLHTALCLIRGHVLTGQMICAKEDLELVEKGLQLIQSVGLKRSRGFGRVALTLRQEDTIQPCAAVPEGNWIHYRLRLRTPLAISQGTSAPTDKDRQNYTNGKDHIPGSAIRGMVMSHLAAEDPAWFAANKELLLQKTVFRSAFPMALAPLPENQALQPLRQIPTPLGFYENREKTRFYHVLGQDVVAGDKRARLGRYCRFEDGKLIHSSPTMESSLRITLTDADSRTPLDGKDRQMFTTEAMAADTLLEGWIHLPEPSLAPRVAGAFHNWLCLGADRFGGSGLCTVELLDGAAPDNGDFGYRDTDPIPETLYMLLLSPTAMSRDGEVGCLSDEDMTALLGVTKAEIKRFATSITQHSGFNRKWGCALPTVNMYAPGSIFQIDCSEAPTLERLRDLEKLGIGIRRSEGCGQVLFLRNFTEIAGHAKQERPDTQRSRDTEALFRRRRERCRWLMNNRIEGNLSDAQCGSLQGRCRNVLQGILQISTVYSFFNNAIEKTTEESADYAAAKAQFERIMTTPLHQTLGCEPFEDSEKERLALYCELFDMNRKEERA